MIVAYIGDKMNEKQKYFLDFIFIIIGFFLVGYSAVYVGKIFSLCFLVVELLVIILTISVYKK